MFASGTHAASTAASGAAASAAASTAASTSTSVVTSWAAPESAGGAAVDPLLQPEATHATTANEVARPRSRRVARMEKLL